MRNWATTLGEDNVDGENLKLNIKNALDPKCSSTDKWMKKMSHTRTRAHTLDYYSAIKKE